MRSDKQLKEQFGAESYKTKMRGDRSVAAMRPAGTGQYQISRHGNHTHLTEVLRISVGTDRINAIHTLVVLHGDLATAACSQALRAAPIG